MSPGETRPKVTRLADFLPGTREFKKKAGSPDAHPCVRPFFKQKSIFENVAKFVNMVYFSLAIYEHQNFPFRFHAVVR